MSSEFDLSFVQAILDSTVESLIVQALLTGWYTHLLYRAIYSAVPGLKNGRHTVLVVSLVLLYIVNVINLASAWAITRSVFISNNETRQSMAEYFFFGSHSLFTIADVTTVLGTIFADALLAWRCYMLWNRAKWILAFFGFLLLAELALIPILFVLRSAPNGGSTALSSLFFISIGITIIATVMITYRIVTVSKYAWASGRYRYIVEILVESGMIYSIILLFQGVVIGIPTPFPKPSVTEAMAIISGVPITGIAPTMIFERILNSTEDDEQRWSRPISVLNFRRNTRVSTTQSQTASDLGGRTTTDQACVSTTMTNDMVMVISCSQNDVEKQ